ncbi:family 43 glycosylhydrolase [Saccharibacillus sp. CPCC 101409]|uniref:family 43 glycosylhydrolase n=1 Tax=Saccharibacillus sp. CPCC 101409 TaxID=3058041 RepID=UPI00267185EF|nr:family 43 glycosylhydrolase [Saccharibacillus sp. CPCC 101409]MDO3408689.1 family 43 glycosylhydrolase [Saccharibacillus sp. CPCC 101409]
MKFTDTDRGHAHAKDPAVVRLNDVYYLYYTLILHDSAGEWSGRGIGIARSGNLQDWVKIGEVPIEQECERNGICAPGAIVLDGRVHLFYQSYGNGPKDAICHAISEDGVHFAKDASNPVFSPHGDWNNGRAIDADVIVREDRLLLYFATRDPLGKVQMQGVAGAALDSGFGRAAWTQLCSESILKPELAWEQDCIEAAALCEHGGKLYMFYGGAYNNAPQQIGCAVSEDGVRWERISDEPFLRSGEPGSWNSSESGHPFVFADDDGRTYLFFQGNNDGGRSWYLSMAEIGWENGLPYIKPAA